MVTSATSARCLVHGCGWGDPALQLMTLAAVDAAAAAHTRKAGHSTVVETTGRLVSRHVPAVCVHDDGTEHPSVGTFPCGRSTP